MKKLSLEYVVRKPKIDIKNPPLLIMIHGYGSNENDLFGFAGELNDDLLIISIRAPYTMAQGSYYWYTINFDANNGKFTDKDEAKESLGLINTFLNEVHDNFEFDKQNIFFLGFSQGAILSHAFSINNPTKIQHVLGLSGYLDNSLLDNPDKLDSKIDYFVSHGTVDQVLPVEAARDIPVFLKKHNLDCVYKEYPIGHGVNPSNFSDLSAWIDQRV
ncbi:MAG: phospholipase [Flavobacteriaceae bacterium]|nr:phospholipase [Flavobacteriaceae bacterium]